MTQMLRRCLATTVVATVAVVSTSCADDALTTSALGASSGRVVVQLTDAPFPVDSLKSADLFIVRIDGKQADADSADADSHTDDVKDEGSDDHGGWKTLAEPNAKIDLLALRDGKAATLGEKALTAGTWRSFRLILDAKQSSVTLKDGTVLTSTSNPGIKFPSADRSGIKIQLNRPLTVGKDSTQTLLVDFDLGSSFQMKGPNMKNGLTLKPEIRGTVK
ncbi:protein of unknown function DUF4382 [Gemmatirosa kalamazoonensis]|uniref:DUF4382 domain-containing protein n=1 Tax=Gemmatirosa kalamazoonensis TaxID=861299 RepID=W0RFM2_9BACT|nr:DUF4382 domain-containing protein [Gemmatirosa kalamazoonensis]AHG89207.1 protein of unknown function DUF4382 [Gemmatirosa kalamazoonensis]